MAENATIIPEQDEPESPGTVLLIDDNPKMHLLLQAATTPEALLSMQLRHVISLDEGLEICLNTPPKAVILDSHLPPYTSYRQTVPLLRDHFDGPIILLTGFPPKALGEHRVDLELAGLFSKDDLVSPGFSEALKEVIEAHVEADDDVAWL